MSSINELLRNGIIGKLQEYDAYIDNELPDYIMVMLANNKTMEQISQDLELFLGENTERFTSWLQEAVSNPEVLRRGGGTAEPAPAPSRKRKKSHTDQPEAQRPQEHFSDRGRGRDRAEEPRPQDYSSDRGRGRERLEEPHPQDLAAERGRGRERVEEPRPQNFDSDRGRGRERAGQTRPQDRERGRRWDRGEEGERPHPLDRDTGRGRGKEREEEMEEGGEDDQFDSEDERPPFPKVSKMRSDRYEELESERSSRYDQRDQEPSTRKRSERPSIKRYDVQSARQSMRKTVRAQPDSTRDQDLRQFIGGSRHRSRSRERISRSQRQHSEGRRRSGGGAGGRGRGRETSEGEEEEEEERREMEEGEELEEGQEEEEEEEEVESATPTTTVASVVKLVERPKRTDIGGSRLLHKAILGLAPLSKQGHKATPSSREGRKREKVIILPASVLEETSPKKILVAKKHLKKKSEVPHSQAQVESGSGGSGGEGGAEEEEEEEEEDEVIVNVDGGVGEEFEEEGEEFELGEQFEEEEFETAAFVAMKKAVAQGNKVKVLMSAGDRKRGRKEEGGQDRKESSGRGRKGEEESVDLRDLINKSREGKSLERKGPRFVVTLSGARGMGGVSPEPATQGNSQPSQVEVLQQDLSGRKSAKDRLGVRRSEVVVEAPKEEEEDGDSGGGGMPERCRFWPNCKNGDSCPFHHPTIPCKLFPDCKFGKKCLFVHPQCKFNSRCTRLDCPYMHTAPRHLAPKQPPQIIPQIIPAPIPVPQIYRPAFNPMYSSSPRVWSPRHHHNKSAFSWKPTTHISERKFAMPDDQMA